MQRPDPTTSMAFLFVVIIGGSNAVAVRFSNLDLPPFWGATLRFSAAALIFWIIVLVFRIEIPRGKGLMGAAAYGLLSVGLSYALLYWGLLRVQASLTMVVLAFTPLMTFFLAIAHGLEPFRWRGLAGALVAVSGILLGVSGAVGANIPLLSLLAIAASAFCIAEGNVLYKRLPRSHPVATNAVAVSSGALLLLVLSLLTGETWTLPGTTSAVMAVSYLVLVGSVVLFYLYLYVLSRWTASATSYAFLLFPVATIIIASWLAGETISAMFIAGGVLVMLGVWLGALSNSRKAQAIRTAPRIPC